MGTHLFRQGAVPFLALSDIFLMLFCASLAFVLAILGWTSILTRSCGGFVSCTDEGEVGALIFILVFIFIKIHLSSNLALAVMHPEITTDRLSKLCRWFVMGVVLWVVFLYGLIYLCWEFNGRPIIIYGSLVFLAYRLYFLACVKVKMDEVWNEEEEEASAGGGVPLKEILTKASMSLEGMFAIVDMVWLAIITTVLLIPLVCVSFYRLIEYSRSQDDVLAAIYLTLLIFNGFQFLLSYDLYVGVEKSNLSKVLRWFRVALIVWILGICGVIYLMDTRYLRSRPSIIIAIACFLTYRLLMLVLVKVFMTRITPPPPPQIQSLSEIVVNNNAVNPSSSG